MKKRLLKPGFEMLFSAGIVAALGLPQLLFAQDRKAVKKEINIVIKDNDTTFNGKNLKKMAPDERQDALAEINKTVKPHSPQRLEFNTRQSINIKGHDGIKSVYTYRRDSSRRYANPTDGLTSRLPNVNFGMEGPIKERLRPEERPLRMRNFSRQNSQTFDFNNVGKDGINTHVSYQVTEAGVEDAKKFAGLNTTSTLELQDLTFTPQFTAGKTVLSFTLPAKTAADVQLTDSEGKIIWKDKTALAGFSKTFTWGLNGVYYLVVKQGGNAVVKRIVKE
ncbi:T9SS type A sorting domain-containing protein [Mucilaginibacter terrae]|uniref:T9SS type A sorting domain-containing protein n=1 Tax=Mucilaginibacter terrae TaxID=1955052 RepID=UPI00362B737E